jgi:hypothetical protein
MSRKPPPLQALERPIVRASEEHIQLVLKGAAVLMAPIVRWLLRNGVSYGAFADGLKAVFVDVARQELERSGSKTTNSALSVLSGVHRKDVSALAEPGSEAAAAITESSRSIPLAAQVFTQWLTDPRYRDRAGKPRPLPRTGPQASFESLATGLSTDVHPRTVLEELVRLGLVQVEDKMVVPRATAFVPSRKLDELTALFAANIADHVAAGVHNLTMNGPKNLEQSVFADGLSASSAEQLHHMARGEWERALQTLVGQARKLVAADADGPQNHRIRFGVYYYSEPITGEPEPAAASAAPSARRKASKKASKTATRTAKGTTRIRRIP